MKVDDEFRSESHYNNVIYSLVGHVIERLAENGYRVTWEQLMEELVLDRLNMTETSFYHDRRHVELFAKHYVHHRVDNKTESVLFDHRLLRPVQFIYLFKLGQNRNRHTMEMFSITL